MEVDKVGIVADSLRRGAVGPAGAVGLFRRLCTGSDHGGPAGALTRADLARGLAGLGLWRPPGGLASLFAAVDDDGSGASCQHEFNLFLAHAPPLRLGDGEQAAYWARRGLTTIHYHRLVCHYDVRAWYPKSEVVLYALDAPRATLYEEPR